MATPLVKLTEEIVTEIIDVTPEMAAEMLTHNTHNRGLRPGRVERYARDMKRGRWPWNGVPITFDRDGVLIEGQHRLHAVIESGVTIRFTVIRGMPPEIQESYDLGIARTGGDALSLRGYTTPNYVASTARRIWEWLDSGPSWNFCATASNISIQDILDLVEGDESIVLAARYAAGHAKHIRAIPSIMGLAYWVFSGIDIEDAEAFFLDLGNPAGLEGSSPVLTLRNRFLSDAIRFSGHSRHGHPSDEEDQMALFCYAWNAFRDHRPLTRFTVRRDYDFPVPR